MFDMTRFNPFSLRRNRRILGPPDYTPDLTSPPSYASAIGSGPSGAPTPHLHNLHSTSIWSATSSAHHHQSRPGIPENAPKREDTVPSFDLPLDILFRIAQFIPETDLKNMLTVSPAFFDIAMDARYRRVSFYDLGNVEVMRRLERLRFHYSISA